MKQWCAVCGNEMQPYLHGGHYQCCDGLGYWSPLKPEKGWPLLYDKTTKLYFYPGPKWASARAKLPR